MLTDCGFWKSAFPPTVFKERTPMKATSRADLKLPYNPWIYFLVFLLSNTLLTFGSLPLVFRFWVLLLGLALPFFLYWATHVEVSPDQRPPYAVEIFTFQHRWIWIFPAGLGLFLRFWRLTDSGLWPEGDEALTGMSALELFQKWHWRLFQDFSQVSSLLSRLCFFTLKLSDNPFLSLYFPPAFLSTLTVLASYFAARRFFSSSFSFLASFLLALNLWAQLVGRTPLAGVLFPLWECGCFYVFGRYLFPSANSSRKKWTCFLGFCAGLGPLTIDPWEVVSFGIIVVIVFEFFKKRPRDYALLFVFFMGLGVALIPFLIAIRTQGFGHHILAVASWKNFSSWWVPVNVAMAYLSVLFWGGVKGLCVPPLGGFLNVLSASSFFVGCLELYRFRREPSTRFIAFFFLLFLSPGFLSNSMETYRIIPLLPLLVIVTALGAQSLWARLSSRGRATFLPLVLLTSLGLDWNRLFLPFNAEDRGTTIPPKQYCYEILKQLSDREGPGFIFPELVPEQSDHILTYATYFFNATLNSDVQARNVKWAAVFTLEHYRPVFSQRFPSSRWFDLPAEAGGPANRHGLVLIPLNPSLAGTFNSWNDFYSWYQGIEFKIIDLADGQPRTEILRNMARFYPWVPNDSLLQSFFFEKLAFNYSWEETFHPEDKEEGWGNLPKIFQQSFDKSCRDAVLSEKLILLMEEGRTIRPSP